MTSVWGIRVVYLEGAACDYVWGIRVVYHRGGSSVWGGIRVVYHTMGKL